MNLRLTLLVAFFLGYSGAIAAPFVHPSLRFEALARRARQPREFLARSNGPGVRVSARGATFGALRMQFVGANQDAPGAGIQPLPATSNYLFGSDQQKWRSGIPCFSQVRFEGVYSGVDLVYKGDGPRLEYDFAVSPYANPAAIGMVFPDAEVRVDDRGDLLVQLGEQAVRFRAPVAYQESGQGRIEVPVQFAISRRRKVRFRLGRYDRAKTLIIDPTLVYSTYLEGSYVPEAPPAVAVDSAGNVYVSGATQFPGAPVTNQLHAPCTGQPFCSAVFVDKFDSKGNLVYATLLGGSSLHLAQALAVDAAGNVYITGLTTSADFPMVNPLPQSRFVGSAVYIARLNPAGSALTFSTFLNGSNTTGAGIAVDTAGNICVTGWTFASDFPTVNAVQPVYGGREDAFVAKIDPAASKLVYSTYLGGSNFDQGHGIALDSAGNAYVTGYTGSVDFPTLNALQPGYAGGTVDAFVAKIGPTGTLLYSTYLGGSGNDQSNGIAVDSTGAVFITGSTSSANFPTVSAVQGQYRSTSGGTNAFVTKFAPSGASLLYSTYLGGAGFDIGYGIALDSAGNAAVAGETISPDFPIASALQSVIATPTRGNSFVSKLDSSGSHLVYSTYLSGSAGAKATAIALDPSGQVYVTGTAYQGFPVFHAYQPNTIPDNSSQAFLARIADESAPCAFGISPTATTLSVLGAGGIGIFTLVANSSGCTWQATSNVPWLTFTQGSSGIGIAPVGYAVAQNPGITPRTGVLTVAGQNISINQAAGAHFTLGAASGVPGSVARIPLGFVPDQTPVYGLTVTIAVSSNAPAPTLSGALSFQTAATLSPPQVTTSAGQITLAWANFFPPLTSQITLGEIVVPVPSAAVSGQLYTLQNTNAAVSLGSISGLAVAGAPATLTVANPAPLATWMTPSAAPPGSAATTVMVYGEGFSNASTVLWNGSTLPTQFISETQLQAAIPASDLVAAATAQMSVSNPAPGGGLSGTLGFLVASGTMPVINAGGVVDSARYGTSIVGGSIAAVFGTNLAPAHVPNNVLPLPTQLGGVTVLVDGVPAPLFDVTPTQITFQVPWRLLTKTQATVAVVLNGFTSNAVTVTPAAFAPAIFTTNSQGTGQGAVLFNSSAIVVDSANPARAGSLINVFATGLGGTVASVTDGTAGSGSVLAPNFPTATIGEIPAKVGFAGIAGFVGLYQINVTIPAGVPSGDAVPLVLTIGGVRSNTVTIAIQ